MNGRPTLTTVIVCVIVALSVGVGIGLLLAPAPVPDAVSSESNVSVVDLSAQPFPDQISVAAQAQVGDEHKFASTAAGTVRATSCVPGQSIASGTPVLTVNNKVVIALHLDAPLWRDLSMGMTGDDVKDFQKELTRLGDTVSVTGTYGADTAAQAAKMWAAAGVKQQSGLPLDQVVWIPDQAETPVSCGQQIGDSRGAGDTVFSVGGQLQSLMLTMPSDPTPGDRVATLEQGVTAAIGADGTVTDSTFLAAYAQTRGYVQWAADHSSSLTVTVELATPVQVVPVAPTSLYQVQGTHACLVDGTGAAVAVQIVASQLGQTFVMASPLPAQAMVPAPKDPPPCG